MATKKTATDVKTIKAKTPEMETFLQAGFPNMNLEKAKTVIKERKENPQSWPYEVYEQAQAFLAAYETAPIAISTDPGWSRKGR